MSVTLFVNIIEYKIHMRTNDGTTLSGASQIEKGKKKKKRINIQVFEQE